MFITKAGKDALFAYFNGPPKWTRNTNMPRINTNPDLDAIINEHNLRRNQAAHQLRNWKGVAYENTQVTLVVEPGDIEAAIADSLSMPFSEFILKFVRDLLSGGGGCGRIV